MKNVIICILFGYLFGCFQTSYIAGKLFKKQDIRKLGTGNAGASNALLSFGWRFGIVVGAFDILKASLSIIFMRYMFKNSTSANSFAFLLYINCLSVIIGHNFPFYMNFRGGKGTACLIGALLAIDLRIAAIGILAIITFALISNYLAMGTMALVSSFTLSTAFYGYGLYCLIIALLTALLSATKHLPNFKNIINGTEHKIREAL